VADEDNTLPAALGRVVPMAGPGRYASWDEVYRDNAVRLYRLMFSKVGNRPDAEDLTTEVFLAAFRPLRLSASRPEVRAYLAKTAQTVLARHWRQRLGVEVTAIDLPAAEQYLADPPAESDAASRAEQALRGLPDRYRQILQLRFLHGMSVKDAARAMGVTVANAKVLQHRALHMAAESGQGWLP
jgi:RNA polymerase sigma factor (sigma-70 family)